MLKDMVSEKLIRLQIEADNWEDAVRQAAQPLVDENKAKMSYVDDIIKGADEARGFASCKTGIGCSGKCDRRRYFEDAGGIRE